MQSAISQKKRHAWLTVGLCFLPALTLPRDTLLLLAFKKPTSEPWTHEQAAPLAPVDTTSAPLLLSGTLRPAVHLRRMPWRAILESVTGLPSSSYCNGCALGIELAWINTHLCNHSALSLGVEYSFGGTVIWRPIGLRFLSCLVSTVCLKRSREKYL